MDFPHNPQFNLYVSRREKSRCLALVSSGPYVILPE